VPHTALNCLSAGKRVA